MPTGSSKRRGGVKPRWGERVQVSSKWPVGHRALYERLAREQGISFNEYLVQFMASAHGLPTPSDRSDEQQLALGA